MRHRYAPVGLYGIDDSITALNGIDGHGLRGGLPTSATALEWAVSGERGSDAGPETLLPDQPSLGPSVALPR